MNPYFTPLSTSALPSSSLSSSSSFSSSQNQLRQDRPSGYHRIPSFGVMPRQGSSSSNVGTLVSPYMPPHDNGQSPHPHRNHNNQSFDPSSHVYEDEGLDEEEDRQSDEGSEGEPGFNDMEYWLQRCSICFDARLDFCLEFCRDQFCRDCFQRYVKEVVSNSWGLNVTKIKCPVCQDTIAQSEWTKYVDQLTLAQYNQYNQPYRSFSRFCNGCEHELVISRVNRSIIGLPVQELQPLFENLLKELKSLLMLAGVNLNDPNAISSKLSHVKSKQRPCLTSRDELAREIVQRFMDDYESFCGIPQGPQLSLPSKAQSYLSNLAYRTLGGPFILPTPSLPTSASFESSGQSSSSSPQFYQHPTASSSSSVHHVQVPQSKANTHINVESIHRNPSAQSQRRQPPVKASGVLEIYKSLMVPLLELLDLQAKGRRDKTETSYCEYGKANWPKGDNIAGGEDESETEYHAVENLELAADTKDKDTDASPSGTKRKGASAQTPPKSKRTRPARSGIITRAEAKRDAETKKKLALFSKHLSSIETRPEQWKELQFLHVRWLRWEWCDNCNQELCLQCGESSHHESQDCFDYMRSLAAGNGEVQDSQKNKPPKAIGVQSPSPGSFVKSLQKGKDRSDLDTNTIQWKLANTNPCPNCCILIHRDDGCNKVDCMLCGYRFCWVCREAWGSACGFYNCGRKPVVTESTLLEPTNKSDEGNGNEHSISFRGSVASEEQVHSLAVSQEMSMESSQVQVGAGSLQQDLLRRRSHEYSTAISEKPEIGVPNVFVIHTKRSRA
ncbi:E3 ubiquitin-protein ligase arih2 [Entomortierella chlamydospora]|uniref:E3 ubiquitin-protein ligase arih2 n=1 Tax=Entomortierella chlamydospora TaxID=101097 RepID=A0A9P6MZG1_9FUNG|nr:E3 ubiquitin-protein ligase arih2 [Entomortierella chlamydospora]